MDRLRRLQPPGDSSAAASESGSGFDAGGAHVPMLDLVQKDGSRIGLPYSYLFEVQLTGDGAVVLRYADKHATIRGRNLLPLYNSLLAHTVRRISVSPTPFDNEEAASWVKEIVIESEESA